ncbi:SMP-30/gluconolactonase/LRE family protein [Paraburkholderia kirstenboschensis]|uniref:SMP-30/gluconolactonase/LRE family protein n=1 Tax=Paraburkholderia kirstenboschensis TaxID=1245436 RepID=A0ABZ0ED60_9BURK|nr:SMP-30/gluconolactonase/LRE family protein [Paraburkholderia kirstenboschensis]WOD14137.1 SMP-30/gluconolactonase/LRE family protein [Paraburkholderia kirstenboschensis]
MRKYSTKVLVGGFVYLEAPRWFQDELWVSDVFDFRLYRVTHSGQKNLVCDVPHRPSGIGFLPDGSPLVVSSTDRKLMKVEHGVLSVYADLSQFATGDLNDLVVDEVGQIYVGNFGYDLLAGEPLKPTNLHLVDRDGQIRIAARDLEFPNGVILKDDGRTLVVAETWSCRLTAFGRHPNGALSRRRVYADLGQRMPDGICVDAEGGVWVASFNSGEFVRVLEGGQITDRIQCGDVRAVSCCLGGSDGTTLFCSIYDGSVNDLKSLKRAGQIVTAQVHIPAASFDTS